MTAAPDLDGEPSANPPPEPDPLPRPEPTPEPAPLGAADALPQVLTVVGSIVAPTTLLTGLLFYFGRLHITGLFRHLGVNFTVLDLTFQDYLIRAADGLFVPLAVAAASSLLLLWVHSLVVRVLPPAARFAVARRMTPLVGLAGIVLLSLAVAGLGGSQAFAASPEVPGLCLAGGILLLAYAVRLLRGLIEVSQPVTRPRSSWRSGPPSS